MALVSWLERWDELGSAERCWGRGWRQQIRGEMGAVLGMRCKLNVHVPVPSWLWGTLGWAGAERGSAKPGSSRLSQGERCFRGAELPRGAGAGLAVSSIPSRHFSGIYSYPGLFLLLNKNKEPSVWARGRRSAAWARLPALTECSFLRRPSRCPRVVSVCERARDPRVFVFRQNFFFSWSLVSVASWR